MKRSVIFAALSLLLTSAAPSLVQANSPTGGRVLINDPQRVATYQTAIQTAFSNQEALICRGSGIGLVRAEGIADYFLQHRFGQIIVDTTGAQPALIAQRTVGTKMFNVTVVTSADYKVIASMTAVESKERVVNRGTLVAPEMGTEFVPTAVYICE